MHIHGINKNHPKDGCIHSLSSVLCSDLPLNIEIILALLVVIINGTRGTVVVLYHHRNLWDSIHQLRLQIITLFFHLTPTNTINGIFSSVRFSIPNKKPTILVNPHDYNSMSTIIIVINALKTFVVTTFM